MIYGMPLKNFVHKVSPVVIIC